MLKNIIITLTLIVITLLSGCATPSKLPRYSQADGYQYIERKITDNYYMLEIISNNKATLHTNTLSQASVLTEQQGFDWYIIVEQHNTDNIKPPYKQHIEIRMGKGIKP